jgi:ketosteroid isomerase-like protein
MKKYLIISLLTILSSCSVNDKSLDNLNNAQSFLDNIITNPEKAKSLLHNDFSFAWMGIIEQGGKLWNKENLFNEYFANIIPEILPNGIILKTVDSISDENGVAIIQVGDAEGKNGEYDNNYVWVFKFKDGLIYELREYNSDLLVDERLYDYKLIKLD